jgi:putative endonuclease
MKSQKRTNKEIGLWGERVAKRALSRKGYKILGKRVLLDARDEIDIVARDGSVLVFVEVKTRASEEYGRPISAVNREKRRVLRRAAVRYLKRKKFPEVNFRFDVIEVVGRIGDKRPVVRHIQNIFNLGSKYYLP